MKIRTFVLTTAALAATALFVACNGGDSDDNGGDTTGTLDSSAIRTEKGLAVAAAGQALGANFGLESADGATIISATGGGSIGGSSVVVPPLAIPAPPGVPDKGLLSVEFVDENYGYRDPYYSDATLRATMTNLGSVDDAVAAAITAADGIADINNSGSNTYFSLSDCSALERAAMVAAVEDAEERADALADVLGVGRGAVIGASSYSYSPYGDSSCSSSYGYAKDGSTLGATDVQVFANVGVTYAIQ